MSYTILQYNGTPIATIPDDSLNTTSSSINLPGRNYPSYGLPVMENIAWILGNFANVTPPPNPILGQLWYDSSNNLLKSWNGDEWIGTGKPIIGGTEPTVDITGQFWYDTNRQQMFVSDTSYTGLWKLIGPIGASNGNDGTSPIPSYSSVDATIVTDSLSTQHNILRITVGGILIAIISKDTVSYSPTPAITGFASINPGINFNTSITGLQLTGNASSATLASNSVNFNGFPTTTFMRNDQSNYPIDSSNNPKDNSWVLGTSSARYASVYSVNFIGTATQALYSDLAERYESDEPLEPGTVVCLGGKKEITISKTIADIDVFGVISTNPAIMMNSGAGNDDTHPYVAFCGRVPVKVTGRINKGDRLMSSNIPGVAQVWQREYGVLCVIGRSLQNKTNDGIEIIEMVIGTK